MPHLSPGTNNNKHHTPNVNSSSLKDIFRVVAMVFVQIMTELGGTKSEENDSGHPKICIKTHKIKSLHVGDIYCLP
jgi:hypothetical protein